MTRARKKTLIASASPSVVQSSTSDHTCSDIDGVGSAGATKTTRKQESIGQPQLTVPILSMNESTESDDPWYVVTRGRRTGVFQGW